MNTVLGVILVIANGQIMGAKTTAAYPSTAVCNQQVQALIKDMLSSQGPPPEGVNLARMCIDLTEDLKPQPPKVAT